MIRAERIESEEEYTFESPQGLRWFVAKAGQLRNLSGAGGRLLVTLEDITRRRIAEEELRNISGRLIHAREEERSRVARDLHDDLSQRLAVLSIELAQLHRNIPEQHTELRSTVRSVLDRTREMASDIHRLSYQLHPFKLDHLGLSAALKSLCDEFSSHHEVRIKFQQEGSAETLQPDITLCLFRIVQEALSNIAKHSGARRAKVVLTTTDEAVRLRVFDRGCGFDAESPKVRQTLGLTSMKERLRLVGGELSIQSRPAKGTGIDAVVPLKRGTKH